MDGMMKVVPGLDDWTWRGCGIGCGCLGWRWGCCLFFGRGVSAVEECCLNWNGWDFVGVCNTPVLLNQAANVIDECG